MRYEPLPPVPALCRSGSKPVMVVAFAPSRPRHYSYRRDDLPAAGRGELSQVIADWTQTFRFFTALAQAPGPVQVGVERYLDRHRALRTGRIGWMPPALVEPELPEDLESLRPGLWWAAGAGITGLCRRCLAPQQAPGATRSPLADARA